jgi:hypothetical protein
MVSSSDVSRYGFLEELELLFWLFSLEFSYLYCKILDKVDINYREGFFINK